MRRWVAVLTGAAMVVACNGAGEGDPQPGASPTPAAGASPEPTPSPVRSSSGARSVSEETDDFLLEYAYPAEAGSIPELAALLDRRLEERRSELASTAARAKREARADGFPYNKHSYMGQWQVVAELPRFLSLSNEFSTYAGGAHGNAGMESLVWDKEEEDAMAGIDLFTSPAALEQALGERYCEALNELREERRGEPVEESSDDPFTDCPEISELTVLPGSASGRRFDRLTLYAGSYVAGPHAEGAYEVDLPVDAAVVESVKPEYRASFAPRN